MFDFDSHLIFTNIRPYAGKIAKFDGGELTLHGGVFGYQSDPITLQFMQDWWEYYEKQADGTWWPAGIGPKEELDMWDQFTLWWLLEGLYKDKINLTIYENDARFNFVHVYKEEECDKNEIVIWHYTIPHSELHGNARNID
jgi:hypothetical protein